MEKLSGAADLDAAVAIAKDAGFDVTQDDLNNYQASQGSISAEELAAISGGKSSHKLTQEQSQQWRAFWSQKI